MGSFYVRPYELLASSNDFCNGPSFDEIRSISCDRLSAAGRNVHPHISVNAPVGTPELRGWWRHSWSMLCGPPGAGKTHTVGQQITRALADPSERFLIVSTTNRTTDAVALQIGEACRVVSPGALSQRKIRRIGNGARHRRFQDARLESVLHGTETAYRWEIETLGNEASRTASVAQRALIRQEISGLRKQIRTRPTETSSTRRYRSS